MRTGIFSYTQVDQVLKLKNLGINQSFQEEILYILHKDGTPWSFLEETRTAFRKGILPYAVVYDYQTDSNLIKENPLKILVIYNFLAMLELIQESKVRLSIGNGMNNFWIQKF